MDYEKKDKLRILKNNILLQKILFIVLIIVFSVILDTSNYINLSYRNDSRNVSLKIGILNVIINGE